MTFDILYNTYINHLYCILYSTYVNHSYCACAASSAIFENKLNGKQAQRVGEIKFELYNRELHSLSFEMVP